MTVLTWRCVAGALIVAALLILDVTGIGVRMPSTVEQWRRLTGVVCATLFVSAIAYTAFARVFGGNEATISACLWEWSKAWPVIPLVIGVLCGHIFFPVWGR